MKNTRPVKHIGKTVSLNVNLWSLLIVFYLQHVCVALPYQHGRQKEWAAGYFSGSILTLGTTWDAKIFIYWTHFQNKQVLAPAGTMPLRFMMFGVFDLDNTVVWLPLSLFHTARTCDSLPYLTILFLLSC